MKAWKLALGLSLAANAVFAIISMRQQAKLKEIDRQHAIGIAMLQKASADVTDVMRGIDVLGNGIETLGNGIEQARESIRDQHLQTIFMKDQLLAYIEERDSHVD